uniref:RRM domain-containing protein n=1 Tax=Myotis myotis TaxID=51298 RepID=A0A7J7YE83_MYOMY|nr:hypothetical protein mMyoMyo1_011066 [Myotis myotis]
MDALTKAVSKLNLKLPQGFRIEASKTEHMDGKMFIGGLSRNTSKEALFDYLSQYGEIIDFTIKTHPETGVSRGFGFVLFKDKAAVEKVLQVKEHQVEGRKFELRKAQAMELKFPPRKVFVGGVNPKMPEDKIRQYFGTFGAIEHIELPVCPKTNERRSFCFITYTDEVPVRKLLETRFHLLGSRPCEVKIAVVNEIPKMPLRRGRDVLFPKLDNASGGVEPPTKPNAPGAGGVNQSVCGACGVDPNAHGACGVDPNAHGACGVDPNAHGACGVDPNAGGAVRVDSNAYGAVKVDQNASGAIAVDPNAGGAVRVDSNAYGAVKVDHNASGAIAVDPNACGAVRVDSNTYGAVKVDQNASGAIAVDPNACGAIRVNPNVYGAVRVDQNASGAITVDPNACGAIRVNTNVYGAVRVDQNASGAIAVDPNACGAIRVNPNVYGAVAVNPNVYGAVRVDQNASGAIAVDPNACGAIRVNPNVYGAVAVNPNVYGAVAVNPNVYGAVAVNPNVYGAVAVDPNVYGAVAVNPNVYGDFRVNRGVYRASGDVGNPTMVLAPVHISPCNQGCNYSDQAYGPFYNAYSNQPIFNSYNGGEHFVGCDYGTQPIGTALANYNVQLNQVPVFSTGYQGIYQPF